MLKKLIFITGLFSSIFSTTVYADILSASKIDFNNQVMNIMSDIESKAITQKNIDKYLSHINASGEIKEAVKSNVLNHVNYSDYRKVADGVYLCNKTNRVANDQRDSKCMWTSSGHYCRYDRGSICHTTGGSGAPHCTP